MGIYLTIKNSKRNKDYVFVDDLSKDCYNSALFRLTFKYDTLSKESIDFIDEYLQNQLNNLIEILNGSDESSVHSGSHEDRIKLLEEEMATLTNDFNSQIPKHGTLKITSMSANMDFNEEGTMLKFTNNDGGVYTTGILKKNEEMEIVLPIGEYVVNVVNSLNDVKDSVFVELWDGAISNDNNHTMRYTVDEREIGLNVVLDYE